MLQLRKRPVTLSTANRGGFTLVEALLVVTIVALVATLAVPRFRGTWQSIRRDRAIDELAGVIRLAQQRAVSENRIYRFSLSAAQGSYGLQRADAGRPGARASFERIDGWAGKPHAIPASISVGRADEEILFFPSGASTGGHIELIDRNGGRATIAVAMTTELITIDEADQ